jgi:hypothetical protein
MVPVTPEPIETIVPLRTRTTTWFRPQATELVICPCSFVSPSMIPWSTGTMYSSSSCCHCVCVCVCWGVMGTRAGHSGWGERIFNNTTDATPDIIASFSDNISLAKNKFGDRNYEQLIAKIGASKSTPCWYGRICG